MTIKELSQLYWLNREIEEDKRRLDELEAMTTSPKSPKYDGMPHAPGYSDTLARCVAEIVDLKAIIAAKQISASMSVPALSGTYPVYRTV